MGYMPTEEEVRASFEDANSIQGDYHRANHLLERRINQLLKRKEITIQGDVGSLLFNRSKNDEEYSNPTERFIQQSMVISASQGIKETVRSSNDWLARFLYEKCESLGSTLESANKIAVGRYAIRNAQG